MKSRYVWIVGAAMLPLMAHPSQAGAAAVGVTADEYALFIEWRNGCDDARLEKDSDPIKIQKIAKSLGVKSATLKAAVDKVQPLATNIVKQTVVTVRLALESTPLKGKILDVVVDDSEEHVVGYVKWRCGDGRDTDKEASYAAWALGQGAPIAKTGSLWCTDAGDIKLFSAKVSVSAAQKIDRASIERFATGRYIKLFEDVKRGPHK